MSAHAIIKCLVKETRSMEDDAGPYVRVVMLNDDVWQVRPGPGYLYVIVDPAGKEHLHDSRSA